MLPGAAPSYTPRKQNQYAIRKTACCSVCNMPGHRSPNCPNNTYGLNNTYDTSPKASHCCSVCKMPGHRRTTCPNNITAPTLAAPPPTLIMPTLDTFLSSCFSTNTALSDLDAELNLSASHPNPLFPQVLAALDLAHRAAKNAMVQLAPIVSTVTRAESEHDRLFRTLTTQINDELEMITSGKIEEHMVGLKRDLVLQLGKAAGKFENELVETSSRKLDDTRGRLVAVVDQFKKEVKAYMNEASSANRNWLQQEQAAFNTAAANETNTVLDAKVQGILDRADIKSIGGAIEEIVKANEQWKDNVLADVKSLEGEQAALRTALGLEVAAREKGKEKFAKTMDDELAVETAAWHDRLVREVAAREKGAKDFAATLDARAVKQVERDTKVESQFKEVTYSYAKYTDEIVASVESELKKDLEEERKKGAERDKQLKELASVVQRMEADENQRAKKKDEKQKERAAKKTERQSWGAVSDSLPAESRKLKKTQKEGKKTGNPASKAAKATTTTASKTASASKPAATTTTTITTARPYTCSICQESGHTKTNCPRGSPRLDPTRDSDPPPPPPPKPTAPSIPRKKLTNGRVVKHSFAPGQNVIIVDSANNQHGKFAGQRGVVTKVEPRADDSDFGVTVKLGLRLGYANVTKLFPFECVEAERESQKTSGGRSTSTSSIARAEEEKGEEGGSWACRICTLVNGSIVLVCVACDAQREKPPPPPGKLVVKKSKKQAAPLNLGYEQDLGCFAGDLAGRVRKKPDTLKQYHENDNKIMRERGELPNSSLKEVKGRPITTNTKAAFDFRNSSTVGEEKEKKKRKREEREKEREEEREKKETGSDSDDSILLSDLKNATPNSDSDNITPFQFEIPKKKKKKKKKKEEEVMSSSDSSDSENARNH